MVRKLSGSAEETDNKDPLSAEPPLYGSHGKKSSFTSAKFDVTAHPDTLDRRKVERSFGLAPGTPDGSTQTINNSPNALKKQPLLDPTNGEFDRNPEPRSWRLSRTRSSWSCSTLTFSIAFLATVFFLAIVHAFLTRQLDSKGCDMCWSRPIYFRFSDFDTEHTRFASKYHLYLHREGGFDEDPQVGDPRAPVMAAG